jgi:hypothetical protein
MSNPLSFNALTDVLASVFDAQFDGRQANKTSYSLSDAGLAAFAVFFMQSPSFLAYQRDMERRKGTSNAATLFGMEQIPTDTHIRNLLDPISPEALFVPFRYASRGLAEAGVLARFALRVRALGFVRAQAKPAAVSGRCTACWRIMGSCSSGVVAATVVAGCTPSHGWRRVDQTSAGAGISPGFLDQPAASATTSTP